MADEDAELVGGISVSVSASNAQLTEDLGRMEAQLANFAKQEVVVTVRAQQGGAAAGATPAAAQATAQAEADAARVASAKTTTAKLTDEERFRNTVIAQLARQQAGAIREATDPTIYIGKQSFGRLSEQVGGIAEGLKGLGVDATQTVAQTATLAAANVTASLGKMDAQVQQSQQAISQGVELPKAAMLDPDEAQANLNVILASLRQFYEQAQQYTKLHVTITADSEIAAPTVTGGGAAVAPAPAAGGGGGRGAGGGGGGRRRGGGRVATAPPPPGEGPPEEGGEGEEEPTVNPAAAAMRTSVAASRRADRARRALYGPGYRPAVSHEERQRTYDRLFAQRDREDARAAREQQQADRDAQAQADLQRRNDILNAPNENATDLSAASYTFANAQQGAPRRSVFATAPGAIRGPGGPRDFVAGLPGIGETGGGGGAGGGGGGLADAARAARRVANEQAREQIRAQRDVQNAAANEAAFAESARVRRVEFDERQQERIIASRRAAITGSGRTSRTLASGIAALFGGTESRQIEAQVRQQQASRVLGSAEREIAPLDARLRELAHSWQANTGEARKYYREQFNAIRSSDQYREALGRVKTALKDDAEATEELRKVSSGGSIARNLAAITVGGLAFGAGLKVADVALSLTSKALGDFIDQTSGFTAVSNKITQGFAQQTLAAHGNVNAVLATAEAQAGLSTAASDAINDQIRLTTQIKAGAAAAGQQGGLFRAALGANQQVPQGLLGGYGGLFGGAAFAQQLGGGAGLAETIKSTFGDFTGATEALQGRVLPPNADLHLLQGLTAQQQQGAQTPVAERPEEIARIAADRAAAEKSLNDAAKRGAAARGDEASSIVHFTSISKEQADALQQTNLPQELKDLASQSHEALAGPTGLVQTYQDAVKGLTQVGVGLSIPEPAQLGRIATYLEQQREIEAAASVPAIQAQQAYERPAFIAAQQRQLNYQIGTQQPAQFALGQLANPNVPVGTGIAYANQGERAREAGTLGGAQALQNQIGTAQQLKATIEDAYDPAIAKNFGAAAVTAFHDAIDAVQQTGAAIASLSAANINEQANYQVAQFNYQLIIARRTLGDISGLTGHAFGVPASQLGTLERANLLLGRQSQLLSFAMSQRQINFQRAVAGFETPGLTPAEMAARQDEAKLETDYAQKQLDIQKQMFGNQVKIVDIQNLRSGYDLARQIALLLRGRQVTLDTAAREQQLLRLQQLQQKNVQRVTSYLNAVDTLAGKAMSDIQQLETAAGHALATVAQQVLNSYSVVIRGLIKQLNGVASYYDNPNGNLTPKTFAASGMAGMTTGTTRLGDVTFGEAGNEAFAILRNPQQMSLGGGGGGTVIIDVHDNNINDERHIDTLVRKITAAQGRQAQLRGLRPLGN